MSGHTIRRGGLWGVILAAAWLGPWAGLAMAISRTWDGGGADDNWSTANNWTANSIPPNDGSTAIVFAGLVRPTPNVDVAWSISSLTFTSGATAFTISGSALTIASSAGITNNDDSIQTINTSVQLAGSQDWDAAAGPLVVGTAGVLGQGFDLTIDGAFNTTINGPISGAGTALIKKGAGVLLMAGSSTYDGGTSINAGTLRLSASNRLPDTGGVTVSGGTFDLQGFSDTVGAVTLISGSITGTTSGVLVGAAYDVRSGTITKKLSGSAALTKTTAGTVILSGNHSYSGPTAVNAGILQLDPPGGGGNTISSAVTIAGGATLRGTGGVKASVINNGIVAPGASAGILPISDSPYTQNAGGSLNIEIGGTTVGTQYDRLSVSGGGTASLAGTLNVTLISGFVPADGNMFDILTASFVSGTFATVNVPSLPPPLIWEVQYLATTVRLNVVCGVGDADGDGIRDACDTCTDTDGDGFGDPGFPANTCPVDNCPYDANPTQTDTDGDGVGDACDAPVQTWDGGGTNDNWTTGSNWNPNSVPVSNGTANIVFTGVTRPAPVVNAPFDINSLTYNPGATIFANSISAALTLRGGGITNNSTNTQAIVGTGNLLLADAMTWDAAAGPLGFTAPVINTGAGTTAIKGSFDTTLGAFSAPSAAVLKNGAGVLNLGNSFFAAGGLTINGGTVRLSSSNLLNDSQIVTIDGGTFDLQDFSDTVGAVTLISGSITGTGTLTGSAYIVQSGTVGAPLGGTAGLVKTTAGTVTLNATNSYTGLSEVQAGILRLGGNDKLADTDSVTVSGGTLDTQGFTDRVGPVTLVSGSITGSSLIGMLWGTSYDVRSGTISTRLVGPGVGLTKSTLGTVTISGPCQYSGVTNVNAGTLHVTNTFGSATGSWVVYINPEGAVTGTGFLGGPVHNSGTVAPGAPLGILSVAQNEEYQQHATGSLDIEIGGTTAGTQYDRLRKLGGGSAYLFGGMLNVTLINGFVPADGNMFDILTASSVIGTFATVNVPSLPPPLIWEIQYLATAVRLSVVCGVGDADGDGIRDACDTCTDTDGDGFGDPGFPTNTCPLDNCPTVSNPTQANADGDALGDACDTCTDTDGDGFGNPGFPANTCPTDNCPGTANANQSDEDNDGIGDACDTCTDTDGDGLGDPGFPANTCATDNCALLANPSQADCNGDGTGDACEQDCNGNGMADDCEITAQLQKLVASDGLANDEFGYSVAISGSTAIVGAYRDDLPSKADAGSAYIYVRSGGAWMEQQHLSAADSAAGDIFGSAVAVSGDLAVVGASGDDHPGASGAGSAYVFTRAGGAWTQQQKLVASDAASGDTLGFAAAISGNTLVVGAPGDSHPGATQAGSAYVFVLSGGVWTQQQKLVASDGSGFDKFGSAVAISGATLVVGADEDAPGGLTQAGSAYVFVRSGGVWTQQQKLVANDAAAIDFFGAAVDVSGDTAMIGAQLDTNAGGTNAGSVYVFVRSGVVWTQQQKLIPTDDDPSHGRFGSSVAMSGETSVVGAPNDFIPGVGQPGSAYVFVRLGGIWTQLAKLNGFEVTNGAGFGGSIAVSAGAAIVGARSDAPAGGASYFFAMKDCNTNTVPDICETDTDGDGYIDPCDNLQILAQPQSLSFCSPAMSSASFTIMTTGIPPVSYQWRRSGTSLVENPPEYTGVLTSTLTLNQTAYNWSDTYDCVMRHPLGGLTVSNPATLSIWPSGGGNGNLSGTTEGRDIQGLVNALLTGGGPARQYCIYDMNLDSMLDYGDIQPFLDVLLTKPLPANDACENALLVTTNALYTGATLNATTDGPIMSCEATCGGACNFAPDVWYRWTADLTGTATFSMCEGPPPFGYDSILVVYDGCPAAGGLEIGCNDDGCAMFETTSKVSSPVTLGHTYLMRISGWRGAKGSFTLRVVQGP